MAEPKKTLRFPGGPNPYDPNVNPYQGSLSPSFQPNVQYPPEQIGAARSYLGLEEVADEAPTQRGFIDVVTGQRVTAGGFYVGQSLTDDFGNQYVVQPGEFSTSPLTITKVGLAPKVGGGAGGSVLTPLDYATARLEFWAARVKAGDMEYKYSRNAWTDEVDYYNTVTWPRYQAEEQNRQNVYEAEWKRFNAQEASERARVDLEMAKQGERTSRSGLVAREILPRAMPAGSMVNLGGAGGGSFEVPSVNLNTFMDQGMAGINYTPPPVPGVYETGPVPGAPVFTAIPPPGIPPVPEEGF